ncbi:hypothetical protein Tco_1566638, partial [Tanacetum coccineum]
MFWHTARDDTLFTSIRCISRHEDTQVYGTILLTEITNQAMLESKAYQTYYAFDSGKKAPKPKLKSKAKVAKPDKKKQLVKKTKAKGLVVLSEVALTEAEQIKLATKRSKKDFHVSHVSGSGDGVDTQSKVPDEGTDSEDEDDTDDGGDNDDDGESNDQDDDNDDERTESDSDEIPDPNLTNVDQTEYKEEDIDDRVRTPSVYEITDEEKLDDEEIMDDEEDDDVINKLYDDVNVNLGNDDT